MVCRKVLSWGLGCIVCLQNQRERFARVMECHIIAGYADDTQVYQILKPTGDWRDLSIRLERRLSDISDWMTTNMLKLNQDKTELIVFAPKHRIKHLSEFSLSFNGTIVNDVSCVKILGVFMDKTLSMEQQVRFHQIRNIGKIRPFITENACKTLVCSLVTSRLDWKCVTIWSK